MTGRIRRAAAAAVRETCLVLTLKILLPLCYRIGSLRPLRPQKVLLLEMHEKEPSDNLRCIRSGLKARGFTEIHFHAPEDLTVSRLTYVRRAARFMWDMSNAGLVFLTDSSRLTSCVTIRPGTAVIQLWHACGAFKRFGYSTSEAEFGGSRRDYDRWPYHRNFSLVTVSSPEVVWAYEEAFNIPAGSGVVRPLGVARTDHYFRKAFYERARRHVREALPQLGEKRIVLLAPTYRGESARAVAPPLPDLQKMAGELGDEYVLLIRQHPFLKKRPALPDTGGFAVDVTELLSAEDVLGSCDICITDYSSLIFEYSLREKPMIFMAADEGDYEMERGFYYAYEEMTPGPVVRTDDELIAAIRACRDFDPAQVHAFREQFMSACDGHATERIIDAALAVREESQAGGSH